MASGSESGSCCPAVQLHVCESVRMACELHGQALLHGPRLGIRAPLCIDVEQTYVRMGV